MGFEHELTVAVRLQHHGRVVDGYLRARPDGMSELGALFGELVVDIADLLRPNQPLWIRLGIGYGVEDVVARARRPVGELPLATRGQRAKPCRSAVPVATDD